MIKANRGGTRTATNKTRIPMGFTSPLYQTGIQVYSAEEKGKPSGEVQVDNLYLISITKAIKEYLQEELRGEIMLPENDLIAKIEAARTLFSDERNRLIEMNLTIKS